MRVQLTRKKFHLDNESFRTAPITHQTAYFINHFITRKIKKLEKEITYEISDTKKIKSREVLCFLSPN